MQTSVRLTSADPTTSRTEAEKRLIPLSQRNPIASLLYRTPISQLVADRQYRGPAGEVISVHIDDTLERVMHLMSRSKIISCPVVDSNNVCVGLFDMRDIATFIIAHAPDPNALERKDLQSLEIAGRTIKNDRVRDVLNVSRKDVFTPLFIEHSALSAAELFTQGAHRAVLFDERRALMGFCSQSDIVRFISVQLKEVAMQAIASKTMNTLQDYWSRQVLKINLDAPVLGAIQKLGSIGVNALAVIDKNGALRGNFSATDLRGLWDDKFERILHSVGAYLEAHSPDSLKLVTIDPNQATLADVCKLIVENHIHRVWVTSKDGKPEGVITLTDLCNIFVNHK